MSPASLRLLWLVLLGSTLLGACGRDERAAPAAAPEPGKVHGSVMKGPVQGATIALKTVNPLTGQPTGTASGTADDTDGDGNFTVTGLPNALVLVESTGGFYYDESDPNTTNRRKVAAGTMHALLPAGATAFAVTPYSQALAQKAYHETATQSTTSYPFSVIYAAVLVQAQQVLAFNPVTTVPANPIAPGGASAAALRYALLLGGAANAINAQSTGAGHLPTFNDVRAFINDLSDGRVDGVCPSTYPSPCPSAAADLNAEIRRFRGNNSDSYATTAAPTINEAALAQPAPVPNQAPTLDPLSPITLLESDTPSPVSLTGISAGPSEGGQTITVTATSSNTALVPNPSITYTSPSATGTLTYTKAVGQSGTATITVTVTDNGGTANGGTNSVSRTLTITVTAVNDPPTISNVADRTIAEDTSTGAVAFTVSDPETPAGSLSVTATSSNTTLVPNANIVLGVNGGNRTVTITPGADQFGSATITLTVSDGALSASDTFLLTVTSVNDLPTISNIADQSSALNTATSPIAFTVGDVETLAASLTVTGASSNQTLVPNANITFGGSGTSRTVTVTPASGQTGTATITVTVTDANSGSVSDPFVLTVSGGSFEAMPAFWWLPYHQALNDGGGDFVVRSDNFATPVQTIVAPGTPGAPSTYQVAHAYHGYLNPDSSLKAFLRDRLVFMQNGMLYHVGLRGSDSLVPVRFSSEAGATTSVVCYDDGPYTTEFQPVGTGASRDAWYRWKVKGADGECNTPDDVYKAARLSDSTTVAPLTVPGYVQDSFSPIEGGSTAVALRGFLFLEKGVENQSSGGDPAFSAGDLTFRDANFANPINLGLSGVRDIHQDVDGISPFALIEIEYFSGVRELRILTVPQSSNPTFGPPLDTISSGHFVSRVEQDANNFYWVDSTFSPSLVSEIWRVPLGGGTPTLMHSTAGRITNVQLTANRIVFQVDPSGTSSPPQSLKSLPKNATTATSATIISSSAASAGSFQTTPTHVFFNTEVSGNPRAFTAHVVPEAGVTDVFTGTAGSSLFFGEVFRDTGSLSGGFIGEDASHVFLLDGFTDFDASRSIGATLYAYDTSAQQLSAAMTTFANVPANNRDLRELYLSQPGTDLSGFCEYTPSEGGDILGDCDIIAVDVTGANAPAYRRITNNTSPFESTYDFGDSVGAPPADADGDGLSDSQEAALGTNPNDPDSDNDGFSDYVEVNQDGDPNTFNPGGGDSNPVDPADRPGNDAPVAGNNIYSTSQDTPLAVSAPGVLGNDSDPEGAPLTANQESPADIGTVDFFNTDGSFSYTPPLGFSGVASFTYSASDGTSSSNIATVTINVGVAPASLLPLLNGLGELQLYDPSQPVSPGGNPLTIDSGLSPTDFQSTTVFSATVDGGTGAFTDIAQARLVYLKGGAVYKVNLQDGSQGQISTITDACEIQAIGEDFADTDNTAMVIRRAADCTSGSQTWTLVRLNTPAGVPGLSPPGLNNVQTLRNPDGSTLGYLTVEGTVLNRRDASFGNPQFLANLDVSNNSMGEFEKGHAFTYLTFDESGGVVGRELFRYDPNGLPAGVGTLTGPHYNFNTQQFGGNKGHSTFSGTEMYFVDGPHLLKIADGDASATLLYNPASPDINEVRFAGGRVILERGSPGSSDVQSVTTDGIGILTLFSTTTPGEQADISAVDPSGRVFITAANQSTGSVRAIRRMADGATAPDLNNAYWAGATFPASLPDINSFDFDNLTGALVLATKGSGDLLETYDPSTGSLIGAFGTILDTAPGQAVFGGGIGTTFQIGAVVDHSGLVNVDAFISDMQAASLDEISAVTTGDDMWALFGGGGGGGGGGATDSDGDGLTDDAEASLGTNPNASDTDGDGFSDFQEVNQDFNPSDYNPGANDSNPNDFNDRPGNDAPIAFDNSYATPPNTPLSVGAPGVLGNDRDPDGTSPAAVVASGSTSPASSGTFSLNANGSFVYTPDPAFTGTATFTYQITDGSLTSNTATVIIDVTSAAAAPFKPIINAAGELRLLDPNLPLDGSNPGTPLDTGLDPNAPGFEAINFAALTISGTSVSNARTSRLAYFKGGSLFKVNLETGVHTQVSSVSTAECGSGDEAENFANPDQSWVNAKAPGPDSTCDTSDDIKTAIRLDTPSGSPGVANPNNHGFSAIWNSTGAVTGFLTAEVVPPASVDVSLACRDASYANPVALINFINPMPSGPAMSTYRKDISTSYVKLSPAASTVRELYRYDHTASGTCSPAQLMGSLYTFGAAGFDGEFEAAANDSANFYFADGNKLMRVPHNATSPTQVVIVATLPAGQDIRNVSVSATAGNGMLVFDAESGSDGSGGVYSVDKTAINATYPATVLALRLNSTFFSTPYTLAGLRELQNGFAYIEEKDFTNDTTRAIRTADNSSIALFDRPNAYWAGSKVPSSFDFSNSGFDDFVLSEIILADRHPGGGDTLKVVNASDGTIGVSLGLIPGAIGGASHSTEVFGLGHFAAITAFIDRNPSPADFDVFFFDTQKANSLQGVPTATTVGGDDFSLAE